MHTNLSRFAQKERVDLYLTSILPTFKQEVGSMNTVTLRTSHDGDYAYPSTTAQTARLDKTSPQYLVSQIRKQCGGAAEACLAHAHNVDKYCNADWLNEEQKKFKDATSQARKESSASSRSLPKEKVPQHKYTNEESGNSRFSLNWFLGQIFSYLPMVY